MRVALVMERIETWRGGAETSTMQFAEHLAAGGCDVTLLTASAAQSTPTLRIVPLHVSSALRAAKTSRFADRVTRYVREQTADFDIVHSITPCIAADIYQPRGGTVPETLARNVAIRSSAAQKGAKRIAQALSWKYRVIARLERELVTRDARPHVIAISQYVARQLEHDYGLPGEYIHPIFNGVDPDSATDAERREHRLNVRRQFHLADDDTVALCVAHNFKLKGVGKLIEALARLRQTGPGAERNNVYALIAGRDDIGPYVKLAKSLGVADRILFSGPTQRIAAFFHAADLLVHPTFYDPCSRVVLEAMSAGLPVITTRYNGAAEKIEDGRHGFVIDSPNDVDALADRIARLCEPGLRASCGTAARLAVADLTMQRHARDVMSLYREVLSRGDTRRGYR